MESENEKRAEKYEFTHEGSPKSRDKMMPASSRKPSNSTSRPSSRLAKSTLALIIIVVLLLVALIVVSVFLAIAHSRDSDDAVQGDMCMNEECIAAAARINSYINNSVLPCDDFYQFACGTWLKQNVIPDDEVYYRPLHSLIEQISVVIKDLLEPKEFNSDPKKSFAKAKVFYRSCMDEDEIRVLNDEDLKDLLLKFGGWLVDSTKSTSFNLAEALSELTVYDTAHLFSLSVEVDAKDSSKRVLQLSVPVVFEGLKNDPKNMRYNELIIDVANSLNSELKGVFLRSGVLNLVNFGNQLYAIVNESRNMQDNNTDQDQIMKIEQLQMDYDLGFEWKNYFIKIWEFAGLSGMNMNNVNIVIKSPKYLSQLGGLLKSTSDRRALANYVIWNFVTQFISSLVGDKVQNSLMDEYKAYGITSKSARYSYCVWRTTVAMGLAVGRVYIRDIFHLDSKSEVQNLTSVLEAQNLTHYVKHSFSELLSGNSWMDASLKTALKEKSEQLSTMIFPEELTKNDLYVDDYYSQYNFSKTKYFNNLIEARKQQFMHKFSDLRAQPGRKSFITPYSIYTSYNYLENQLTLPPAILQPPFISNNYPKYLSYGALGTQVAGEIISSFRAHGIYLDKLRRQVKIRGHVNLSVYNQVVNCFRNQYGVKTESRDSSEDDGSKFPIDSVTYRAGGIKVAFMAYKKWAAKQEKLEQRLPSLKFDQNQLFFLSFAQLNCEKMKEIYVSNFNVPNRRRISVTAALQNFPEFAKAFNCPVNSYMNPKTKCTVW